MVGTLRHKVERWRWQRAQRLEQQQEALSAHQLEKVLATLLDVPEDAFPVPDPWREPSAEEEVLSAQLPRAVAPVVPPGVQAALDAMAYHAPFSAHHVLVAPSGRRGGGGTGGELTWTVLCSSIGDAYNQ